MFLPAKLYNSSDLKKLIKYEQRKQQNIQVPILYDIADLGKVAQVDSRIYSTNTTISTKMKPKMKEKVITVEVKRTKKRDCAPADDCEHQHENARVNNEEANSKPTEKLSGHSQESRMVVKPTASCKTYNTDN